MCDSPRAGLAEAIMQARPELTARPKPGSCCLTLSCATCGAFRGLVAPRILMHYQEQHRLGVVLDEYIARWGPCKHG